MCGRFVQARAMEKAAKLLNIQLTLDLPSQYNLAPSLPVAAIRAGTTTPQWILLRWGLVPHWATDIKTTYKMINAKAETVAEKPAYRGAFRHRRCIIPADGFYEWQERAGGKQPFYIRLADESPMLFAGLWEHCEHDGNVLETCAIITTSASPSIEHVHNRMPVVLTAANSENWLDHHHYDRHQLESLLVPASQPLIAYPVDRRVNKPANNDARCIEPVADA